MNTAALPRFEHYIGGEDAAPSGGAYYETQNPFTGCAWASVARGDSVDVDRAVRAAHAAFESGPWAELSATQRGALLFRLAELLVRDAQALA